MYFHFYSNLVLLVFWANYYTAIMGIKFEVPESSWRLRYNYGSSELTTAIHGTVGDTPWFGWCWRQCCYKISIRRLPGAGLRDSVCGWGENETLDDALSNHGIRQCLVSLCHSGESETLDDARSNHGIRQCLVSLCLWLKGEWDTRIWWRSI